MTPLRWFLRSLGLLLIAVFGTLPVVMCMNRYAARIHIAGKGLDEFMLNAWAGAVCWVFGVRVRQQGEPVPPPVLVVANHISWLDIVVLHRCAAMGFVSKAEIRRWPVLGFLARVGGTVFHERGSRDSAESVSRAMSERLRDRARVAIFAEGGILPGPGVKRFHARLFKAAIEAECPVQPVMIRYRFQGSVDDFAGFAARESFPANLLRLMGRPRRECDVAFLDAFDASGRARREVAAQAQAAVASAFEAAA